MCHELCRHGSPANSDRAVYKAGLQNLAALPVFAAGLCPIDSCVAKLPFLHALKKSYAVQMIHRNWIQHCHKASLFIYFQLQVGVV